MESILRGVRHFHDHVFPTKRELFESLAESQRPNVLFITCSDSRVHPNLITQTEPGELFILRNPGNIIPPYQAGTGSEAATIEYAIEVLKVTDIVVCGHSNCGAIKALLQKGDLPQLRAVSDWLHHAEGTRRIIEGNNTSMSCDERLQLGVEKNVLFQVDNLRTHPAVAARLDAGRLRIHAWIYEIASGEVHQHDRDSGQFQSLVGEGALERKLLELSV
jgi:carbonic anhydrase